MPPRKMKSRKVTQKEKQPGRAKHPSCQSRTEILVRLAGFEPTTPWFVAKYSIQLSYSREGPEYSSTGGALAGRRAKPGSALAVVAGAKAGIVRWLAALMVF